MPLSPVRWRGVVGTPLTFFRSDGYGGGEFPGGTCDQESVSGFVEGIAIGRNLPKPFGYESAEGIGLGVFKFQFQCLFDAT